jgi:hypothetical protein
MGKISSCLAIPFILDCRTCKTKVIIAGKAGNFQFKNITSMFVIY